MSIDFDGGALQTQHDDEEYDKEDYAREQELQKLLTDLPHHMLDDSLCSSSSPNFSDCSDHELPEQHPNWDPKEHWENNAGMSDPENQYQNGYIDRTNPAQYMGLQNGPPRSQEVEEAMQNGWGALKRDKEGKLFHNQYNYPKEPANEESDVGTFHSDSHYDGPDRCSTSELYHLPEDFQPYTNSGHQRGEDLPEVQREQFQMFPVSDGNGHQTSEKIQLKYNPYQLNTMTKDGANPDPVRRDDHYGDLQREFLDTGTSNNIQFVQLQVLYKARGRQLEELNAKFEESERQLRYLSHQLTIVKDEKDGVAMSLQESQALLQSAKEEELQLQGRMAALQKTVDGLTTNDEQLRKELKVAKLAMDSMQQQVMELRRSDSIHRAREQHEAVVAMLTKKNEEQVLSLQQKLDKVNAALTEQKEICSRLEQQVKLSERNQEEIKMEKTEIINRLTRSLEESQKQCANLLHTGSIQETTQLRMQLQQMQSSKLISDGMNKALQEEISELKEQITMYESAAKMGVFISDEEEQELSDSYVDLGIPKANWQKSRFSRVMHTNGVRKDLSSDEIIMELKSEFERCLRSNKAKRLQIVHLQSDLKGHQSKNEELKKLLESAEKEAKASSSNFDSRLDSRSPRRSGADTDQEIQRLKEQNQQLQQEIEKHLLCIKEIATNEEKLKSANQQLCTEMRQMLEDFDKDKKEAIERYERTYERHHEDIKNHIRMELSETCEAEKEQLCQAYEAKIANLESQIIELTNEMTAVQECYIAVCKEKDTLQDDVRDSMKREFQLNEDKWRGELIQDKEKSLQTLKTELELKHQFSLSEAQAQWETEREHTMKVQFDAQLALAKDSWTKEHEKKTELRILEIQWRHKQDRAVQDGRAKSLQNLEDHAIQTEETVTAQSASDAERLEDVRLQLQTAVQEKERAVQEVRLDLEAQHREDISKQIELALVKAHARWLEELTGLSEYKANLRLERGKWEKLQELNVKKQISDAVVAAEENWKSGADRVDYSKNEAELEEKVASLKRELERKNEEFEARMKVELGEARALWNKERQEEIQQIQAQNEKDYRTFLNEHRTKISELLSAAKADFEKQKNELVSQKEVECREINNQQMKQRMWDESLRTQDHQKEVLSEIERLMSDIHDELIEKRVPGCFSCPSSNLDAQFLDRLRSCLHRSVKGVVYKAVSSAKSEWKQKPGENLVNRDAKVSMSVQDRSYSRNADGATKSNKKNPSEKQTNDEQLTRKGDDPAFCCCENCLQQLERYKKDCQELRSKLDKACRHLQEAVKDQKLKAEQFKSNEIVTQALRKENAELHKNLEKMKSSSTSQSTPQGQSSEKGCDLCRGNALEDMRAQYIKAVDKIKNDMLRYIHESKGRAAEMLKNEVLRERQETARKMRKYYLTCLQQLLKDDGKYEGAEKKIMNAASKLATMARVLETPISQKTQSRNLRVGLAVSQDETEPEAIKPMKNVLSCSSNRSTDPNTEQKALDELIRRHMKEKLDGDRYPNTEESSAIKPDLSTQIGMDCIERNLKPVHVGRSVSTPLEDGLAFNGPNAHGDSLQVTLRKPSKPSVIHGLKDRSGHGHPKSRADRPKFELQETPVRDENGSNDWSCLNSKGLFLTETTESSLTNTSQNPSAPGNLSAAGLFSFAEGSRDAFGSRYEGQNHSAHIAKKRDQTLGARHPSKVVGHPPTAVESKPYSDVGRSNQLPSRKLLLDFASPRQDSGFDSPLLS